MLRKKWLSASLAAIMILGQIHLGAFATEIDSGSHSEESTEITESESNDAVTSSSEASSSQSSSESGSSSDDTASSEEAQPSSSDVASSEASSSSSQSSSESESSSSGSSSSEETQSSSSGASSDESSSSSSEESSSEDSSSSSESASSSNGDLDSSSSESPTDSVSSSEASPIDSSSASSSVVDSAVLDSAVTNEDNKMAGKFEGDLLGDPLLPTDEEGNDDNGVLQGSSSLTMRTESEIREYAKRLNYAGVSSFRKTSYSEEPSIVSPYKLGKVSARTLEDALDATNIVRYIAGLPEVSMSSAYNESAQYASVVLSACGKGLNHNPPDSWKPANMSQEFFKLGYEGTSTSNLAGTYQDKDIAYTITRQYMSDEDTGNMDRVGHRRWILSPKLGRIGFGIAPGSPWQYSAARVFDSSNPVSYDYIAWPSRGAFPIEYLFTNKYLWSVSLGPDYDKAKISEIKVKLTRLNDGKSWEMTRSDDKVSSSGKYLHVDTANYGYTPNTIIFRPDASSLGNYRHGDRFRVEITGLSQNLTYEVDMFSFDKPPTSGIRLLEKVALMKGTSKDLTVTFASEPQNPVELEWTVTSGSDVIKLTPEPGTYKAKIEGLKTGKATINVKAGNLGSATCTVSVGDISLQEKLTVDSGKSTVLALKLLPDEDTFSQMNYSVKWTSSKPECVWIDSTAQGAKVTLVGKQSGESTVTAEFTCGDLKITASCKVTVNPVVNGVVFVENSKNTIEKAFTIGQDRTLRVMVNAAGLAPEETSAVKWESTNNAIASVTQKPDDPSTAIITPKTPGTVQIRAKCADQTATATIKVYRLTPGETISYTVTPPLEAYGIQKGESVQVSLAPLSVSDFNILSSNSSVASTTVPREGNTFTINAVNTGTTKVTATLRDDFEKRKFTLTIKVVDNLAGEVKITAASGGPQIVTPAEGVPYISLESKDALNKRTFTLNAEVLPTNAAGFKLKWLSADTKVAKIQAQNDGKTALVTITGEGSTEITAQAQDARKTSASVHIDVRNYEPRLESSTISVNTQTSGTMIVPRAAFGNDVTELALSGFDSLAGLKLEKKTEGQWLLSSTSAKSKSWKGVIAATTAKGKIDLPVTVKVASKVPVPKITVPKINLELTERAYPMPITVKDAEIEKVEIGITGATWKDGILTLPEKLPVSNGKLRLSGTVKVYYKDYLTPYSKTIALTGTTKAIKLIASPASSTINGTITKDVTVELLDSRKKPLEDGTIKAITISNNGGLSGLTVSQSGNNAIFHIPLKTGVGVYTTELKIEGNNWASPVYLRVKLTAKNTVPTVKLSKSTLTLNGQSRYRNSTDSVLMKLSIPSSNPTVKIEAVGKDSGVTFTCENSIITATVPEGGLPAGTFKYKITPTIQSVDNKPMELKPVTLNVKVLTSEPKVSVSARGKLDLIDRENSEVVYTPRVSGMSAPITDMRLIENDPVIGKDSAPRFICTYDAESGKATVKANPESNDIRAKTKYRVHFEIDTDGYIIRTGEVIITPVQSSIKASFTPSPVTVWQGAPGIGRLVALNVKGAKGVEVQRVSLLDSKKLPAGTFRLVTDEDGRLWIYLARPGAVKANAKYSLDVEVTCVGQDTSPKQKPYKAKLTVMVRR